MKAKTVGQKIFNQIRHDIVYGKLSPGEHLSGKLLTERYKISRALMREVIGQLDSQGFVLVVPNRGAFVTKLSVEDYDVVYNILARCESYAARLFVENWDKTIVKKMKALHKKMKAQNLISNQMAWLDMNSQFHELISSNCGSRILSDIIYNNRLRLYRFRLFGVELKSFDVYNAHHAEILAAISDKDGRLAEKLMAKHIKTIPIEYSKEHRYKLLKKSGKLI